MADRWDRYRAIPTFGRGVIRQFSRNAAAMKKLAARDFEDLLQVMSTMLMIYWSVNVFLVFNPSL